MDKVELLQELIENSKHFEFVENDILKISSYNNNKAIYVNFTGLIESMYEKLNDVHINRILWNKDEYEEEDI